MKRYVVEYGETKVDLLVMAKDLEERDNQLRRQIEELDQQRSMLSGLIETRKRQESKALWSRDVEELSPEERLERELSGLAATTRYNYVSAFNRADEFFQGSEVTDGRLADYMEHRYGLGLSPGAIEIDARALKFRAAAMDLPIPWGRQCKATMRKIRREGASRGRGTAKALRQPEVDKLVARCESEFSLAGLRDGALIGLMFECLLRIGEAGALQVEDLKPEPDGSARLRIRQSKTDQDGSGVYLFVGQPVYQRVRLWIEKARIESGPIFRKVEKGGQVGSSELKPISVRYIIQKRAKQCGFKGITGHSLRRGMAQQLTDEGMTIQEVATAGRWKKTDQVIRYVQSRICNRGAVAKRYQRA